MTPAISAILATHNRAHLLTAVLDGLQRQTLSASDFELVVVDDGSSDHTMMSLANYSQCFPLRMFHQAPSGRTAAKNLGIFAARAPLVVFLDDDKVPDPDCLGAHLAAHETQPEMTTMVVGYTRIDPEVARSPLMRHATKFADQFSPYRSIKAGDVISYQELREGQISCKRRFLVHKGVFNSIFGSGCANVEFAWRLSQHGLHIIFEPAASASMIHSISFDEFCRGSYLWGRSQFIFSRLHHQEEVQLYCEIEKSSNAWAEAWRDYPSILRRARELDWFAAMQVRDCLTLSSKFQEQLEAAYRSASFLSCAKGITDAAWLAKSDMLHRPATDILPQNFTDFLSRMRTTQIYPAGSDSTSALGVNNNAR